MVILASASTRRQELLKKLCSDFIVEPCEVEEIEIAKTPDEVALANAMLKAITSSKSHPDDIIIAADTVVALDGKIFGKPKNKTEARKMLRELAGKQHQVITGVAIAKNGELFADYDTTEVFFGEMTNQEIADYVNTGEPLDKSGSYALQGGAAKYIERIFGDWSNVVGLPLYTLRQLAKNAKISELI